MNQNFERPYTEDDVRKNCLLGSFASRYLLSRPKAQRGNRKFAGIKRNYRSSWDYTLSNSEVAYILNRMVADPDQPHELPAPGTVRRRREQFVAMNAHVRVPYAMARTGSLIHAVDPGEAHYTIWEAPRENGVNWMEPAESGQASFRDLNVKVMCKFPSWMKDPVLLTVEEAAQRVNSLPPPGSKETVVNYCHRCASLVDMAEERFSKENHSV